MNRATTFGSFFLGAVLSQSALAASTPLAGTEWALDGSFGGTVNVKCKVGGARSVPIKRTKGVPATVKFDEGGRFTWSDGGFTGIQPAEGATGGWSVKGNKVNLTFDRDEYSSLRLYAKYMAGSYSGGVPGGQANVNFGTGKYSFSGTVKGAKLQVKESLAMKIDANASAAGGSNACTYNLNLVRTYKGSKK